MKAALFDLDNLLVNTEPLHFEAYSFAMREVGVIVSEKERVQGIGIPAPVNIRRVLLEQERTDIDAEKVIARRQQNYLEIIQTREIALMPGAREILQWIVDHHIPRIIASSSTGEQIATVLERTGLNKTFSRLVSFEDVKNGKPAPDIYLEAARRLKINPKLCVVFDDAAPGIIAGKAAGCYCVAVPNEYTEKGDFSKADLVVKSLRGVDCELIFG